MIDNIDVAEPDWSKFDAHPMNELECRCGAIWHAHSKGVIAAARFVIVARTPCPACGSRTNLRRSSSPPETWTIGSKP